jgi:organic hydroperoxide reductase OsmC/OhrA
MADVFTCHLEWSGASGGPTRDAASYSRDLDTSVAGLRVPMSAAPGSRGDASRANPEQLLVASLSACQALTYLFVAAKHGVPIAGYSDDADGHLTVVDGRIRMGRVSLHPRIALVSREHEQQAHALVDEAHRQCIIANSVQVRLDIEPTFVLAEASS